MISIASAKQAGPVSGVTTSEVDSFPAYEFYGGFGGGIEWVEGVEEGDVTGNVIAVYNIYEASVSMAVEYEVDADEALLGVGGEPEDQWTKFGVMYRGDQLGFMGSAVRVGEFGDVPTTGFEAAGLVALGDPDDHWSTFLRAVYTKEDAQSVRVGVFARIK